VVWQRALRGELAYELTVRLAIDGDEIAGGICYERYPRSACGLVTYMVVAPAARGQGLGERLLREAAQALYAGGAPIVFGEAIAPDRLARLDGDYEGATAARRRIERFQRWGARVAQVPYVQPALGPGLSRDHGLVLLVFAGEAPLPADVPGAVVRAFIEELYAVTEGGAPDEQIVVGERVPLAVARW